MADISPSADSIFGGGPVRQTDDRLSLVPLLDAAGLTALDGAATVEHVEAALVKLRESLPAELDALSRETMKVEIKRRLAEQGAPVTAPMVAAALAAPPVPASDDDRPRRSQASQIVDLALGAGVELWHSDSGDAFISIPAEGYTEHHKLNARPVRDWLARRFFLKTNSAAGSQAIADASSVLAGKARYDGPMHSTAVRVAGDRQRVVLDLGVEGRAVEVTLDGWRLVDDPPVRFIRSRGMLPLPTPMRGGSVDALRELVHVQSDDDLRLLAGWLLGALRPKGPYPAVALVGEQGSGKSTAARVVRRLIDPHTAELRTEPRAIDDVMIAASRSRVVAFDNLSHIAPWLSDALCCLATGGALSKRELYTNDDETILQAERPVLLTAISDVVSRGDLLDRSIVLTLPPLSASERQSEAELWQRFNALAPSILGALLDGVVSALAREATTKIDRLPRMADWAIWATAAEAGLGWSSGSILSSYWTMRDMAVLTHLDGDPLAGAVRGLVLPWTGTAGDLLTRVTPAGRAPRGWPESPRALSAALRRLAPGLRAAGVEVTPRREAHTGRRLVDITRSEDSRDFASPSSPSSPGQQIRAFSGDAKGDANASGDTAGDFASPDPACLFGLRDDGDDGDAVSQRSSGGDGYDL